MNLRFATPIVVTLAAIPWLAAQDPALESLDNPLLKAFLSPDLEPSEPPEEITAPEEPATVAPVEPAMIPPAEESTAPAVEEAPVEAPASPSPGLAVRVEKLQAGAGQIDPAQVKLRAPFPAKLLAQTPSGWRLESSETAPPFTREVELSPGKSITLSVRPHLLVPEADGAGVFQVAEPGFEAALGYRQDATVGAILATSIRQLDDDSKQLGTAIEQLQQLLVSLPQPEAPPPPALESSKPRKQ